MSYEGICYGKIYSLSLKGYWGYLVVVSEVKMH